MQEAYPFTVKEKGKAKDQWDTLALGGAIPGPNESLEKHCADEGTESLRDVVILIDPHADGVRSLPCGEGRPSEAEAGVGVYA